MRNTLPILAIAVSVAAATASPAAAQVPPPTAPISSTRFEVGGQFSALQLADVKGTHAGIGGRAAYDITNWASLEAEANFFPNEDVTISVMPGVSHLQVEYRRRRAEAFFGPKLGVRFQRFGIFAKVRPGFTRLSDRGTLCSGPGCASASLVVPAYRTDFAMDLGGVLEFYPTTRFVARVDLGDTAITDRSVAPPFQRNTTTHNFASRFGFGFRF